jgi:hypothetical protein
MMASNSVLVPGMSPIVSLRMIDLISLQILMVFSQCWGVVSVQMTPNV